MKNRKSPTWLLTLVSILLLAILAMTFPERAFASPGDIVRASVASNGSQSNGFSDWASLSSDGRYVAFYSEASNLVSGDTNGLADEFVRDLQTGITRRVSTSTTGTQGNGHSHDPAISADGRYVAFISLATNLVPQTDNYGGYDVFVHDLQTGTTTAVSVTLDGTLGNQNSYHQSISADGRYIAFNSPVSNFVSGDTNSVSDIFLLDMQTSVLTRISVGLNGAQANGPSHYTNMSLDGRYVTFHSAATNLVAGDTNGKIDVFVYDTQTGVTRRVSVVSGGTQALSGDSLYPAISADGRYVAFRSLAANLVAGDTNAKWDIFVHDIPTGITSLVSADSAGNIANNDSQKPHISADGRYIAFDSYAGNLVAGDTNQQGDVFLRDIQTGTTIRVSVDGNSGQATGGESRYPAISLNGQYVAFTSFATNLVAGDTNSNPDIFIYENDLLSPPVATLTATSTSATAAYTATSTFTQAPSTPTSTPAVCTDPTTCNPVTAITSSWRCNISECSGADWPGAVIAWPSWSAYSNNARTGNDSRTVYSLSGTELYPYMGSWADGCQVTAISGKVLIIEWQRGTETWRATQLDPGQSHTIDLITPEDNALIEAPDGYTSFSISLANCTPQNIYPTPTTTATATHTATFTATTIPSATATDTPSPTATATHTATFTATTIPSATATNTPSPTATATHTSTPEPTQTATIIPPTTMLSISVQDGWILESTENGNTGGTMNNAGTTLRLGDDASDKQYRAILSFDTSTLPDNAIITSVTLKFKNAGTTGTLPFNTHGNLFVDVRNGAFRNNSALELGDFNAADSRTKVLTYTNNMIDSWFSQSFNLADFHYINLRDITQFRLRFSKDDNNDVGADFLSIYSGNAVVTDQPQLIIEYYIP